MTSQNQQPTRRQIMAGGAAAVGGAALLGPSVFARSALGQNAPSIWIVRGGSVPSTAGKAPA